MSKVFLNATLLSLSVMACAMAGGGSSSSSEEGDGNSSKGIHASRPALPVEMPGAQMEEGSGNAPAAAPKTPAEIELEQKRLTVEALRLQLELAKLEFAKSQANAAVPAPTPAPVAAPAPQPAPAPEVDKATQKRANTTPAVPGQAGRNIRVDEHGNPKIVLGKNNDLRKLGNKTSKTVKKVRKIF